jgi:hypothetical protein
MCGSGDDANPRTNRHANGSGQRRAYRLPDRTGNSDA